MAVTVTGAKLQVTEEGGRTVARFAAGTMLTEANDEEMGRELTALVAGRDRPNVALDLGGVELVSSVGLAKLLSLNTALREAGGSLSLINLKPLVHQIFVVSRLNLVLDIHPAPTLRA